MRAALCLPAMVLAMPAFAQIRSVTLQPPARVLGVLVGDTLAATAVIDVGPDTVLDTASLPSSGPVTPSIDIRGIGTASSGSAAGRRYTVRVTYQNFTTPDHVGSVDVPGYTLAFRQSGKRVTAVVPGFSFTASPIQNANEVVVDASSLRPDRPFGLMDVTGPTRLIVAGCAMALLACGGLALTLGSMAWPLRRAGPFALALRGMRAGKADADAAFLLLHRAFDETAGMRVLAEDLDDFFVRHPGFGARRADIEAFFASSRQLFFGRPAAVTPGSAERLARALVRVERNR